MVRTFVALMIPKPWIRYLARIEEELSNRMSGLSWVKPDNMHITIRFLGDLGDSGVRRAGESARRGADPHAAFHARLGELGAFPTVNRPRILWMGLVEGSAESAALAKSVNHSLQSDGFGPPPSPSGPTSPWRGFASRRRGWKRCVSTRFRLLLRRRRSTGSW